MDCSPPVFSVCGILQARILEWIAIPFSRAFSQPRDQTQVSCIASEFFTIWATRNWISALIKEIPTEVANPSACEVQGEFSKTRRRAPLNHVGATILDFQHPELW